MKKILFALLCMACTGTAWAQSPIPTELPPAQGPTLQLVAGRILARDACCNSPCPPACPQPCKNACPQACKTACPREPVCISVPAKKIEKKITYSSACEKVCFKSCSSLLRGCNTGCDQGNCESKVYTQKYLVKKVCVTECDTYKCVPVNPNCDGCRTGILQGHHHQQPGVVVETIPAQPMPPAKK